MNICLFKPEEIAKPLDIKDERAVHLLKILHKGEGDSFAAGIIGGKAGRATITRLDLHEEKSADGRKTFKKGSISFDFVGESDGKPLFPLKMIVGFPRPIQLKRLLRDMAGLGVCEIHLTATELGEKSYLKSDLARSDSGYGMLLEGCEQAASTHIPKLFMHDSLAKCLDFLENADFCEGGASSASASSATGKFLKAALDNVGASESLVSFMARNWRQNEALCGAVAAIGSERGWTEGERKLLEERGYSRLCMGSRVLRTETAATVAASLILGAMGYLN
ncbi:MAG: RsmE family RNA methyltransferase [Treponema sp.]|nr:RsmE family RNA methyltransferase [Treponema sp.]